MNFYQVIRKILSDLKRCEWATNDLLEKYHDKEWGKPLHDDKKLFEFLVLDGMQAGLSWDIILRKRTGLRNAFDRFELKKVAEYGKREISRLLKDEGIIRNEQKIKSVVNNAQRFLKVQEEFSSFDQYIWSFVEYNIKINKYKKWRNIPSTSKESELMSKDLKRRGFTFVGPTICYAFMQSVGMVNDHVTCCFRYKQV